MKKEIALAAAALLSLGIMAQSQTVSVSASAGFLFPKEKIYRDIYGQSYPFALALRVGISRHFGLSVGIEYLSDSGTALNINQGETEYPLRFRMISYPVSADFLFPLGKISIFIGAGIGFHSYREEWEDWNLTHEGNASKLFFSGGVEFPIVSRVAVRFSVRYEDIVTTRSPYLQRKVSLGGLSLFGGVSFRIR